MKHIPKSCWIVILLIVCNASCRAEYFVKLEPTDNEEQVMHKAASVVPHPRQIAWQREEYTAFIHFGMNTMTNREWGRGTEDPALFNPEKLDARQWAAAIKDAGMTQVIVTAKHHDGFCLWPSAFTEHSVKNSPWKGGKGDVVREVSDAAREAGLKFGFYLSPWDRNLPLFGTPEYDKYYDNQLRELLTGYGPVHEVWMDGACGSAHDPDSRCQGVKYDWDTIFATVRELQTDAAMSIYGPDVRWIGNEAGENPATQWSVLPVSTPAGDMVPGSRAHLMAAARNGDSLRWYPAQADTSIRPGWFYHPGEDYLVKTNNQLFHIWFNTVGGNAQLLLNIPPGPDGLIHKNDIKALKALRKRIDAIYDRNYITGARGEAAAIDGNQDTFWEGQPGGGELSLEYTLPEPVTFDIAMLQEHIASGQRIEAFAVDAEINNQWVEIASGTTVGYKRFVQFEPVTATRVRIRFKEYRVAPTLAEFALFTMAPSETAITESAGLAPPTILPEPPQGKQFLLSFHDEFDGKELDTAKWNIAEGPRRDGFWRRDAISLDGQGNIMISVFKDGDKYIDGEVDTQGKFEQVYGYFEARAKLHTQPGHWSAFWLMPRDICGKSHKGKDGIEVDIFEKIDQSDTVLHNLHWDCYCGPFCDAGKKVDIPGVMQGFHTFSFLWTPDEYVFYIDGVETWRTDAGGICRVPLYVLLSDEIGTWAGDIKSAQLPDTFVVDYVRVYDIVDK